jgi:hypothetical protein
MNMNTNTSLIPMSTERGLDLPLCAEELGKTACWMAA